MGWLIAILAGGFFTFNAVVTPDKAAGKATEALKARFPGADVKVVIEGKRGKNVLNGRFRSIDIDLANLSLDELPFGSNAVAAPVNSVANAPVVRQSDGAIRVGEPRAASEAKLKAVEIRAPKAAKIKLGHVDDIHIAVRDFKWQKLSVARADFRFADVDYDFGALKNQSQFKLVRAGKSSLHLELAPETLTPFIAQRVTDVTRPKLAFNNEQMVITGARNFYGLSAPFELRGQPAFLGSQIVLTQPKLLVSGVTVPALVAAPLLKSVNPLYSFDVFNDSPFAVTLTQVQARDGKLQIDGDLILK